LTDDGFGRLGGLHGERFDLGRHDRKTAAGLAGACGFDGGVQRQQVVCPAMLWISLTMSPMSQSRSVTRAMAGDIRTLLIWAKLYHGFADHVGLDRPFQQGIGRAHPKVHETGGWIGFCHERSSTGRRRPKRSGRRLRRRSGRRRTPCKRS